MVLWAFQAQSRHWGRSYTRSANAVIQNSATLFLNGPARTLDRPRQGLKGPQTRSANAVIQNSATLL